MPRLAKALPWRECARAAATTSGRARCTWEWMQKAARFTGLVPSTTVPSWLTRINSDTLIWLKLMPNGLTQKCSGYSGSRAVMWPATPSENPSLPKTRNAPASCCLRYNRSAATSACCGGPVRAALLPSARLRTLSVTVIWSPSRSCPPVPAPAGFAYRAARRPGCQGPARARWPAGAARSVDRHRAAADQVHRDQAEHDGAVLINQLGPGPDQATVGLGAGNPGLGNGGPQPQPVTGPDRRGPAQLIDAGRGEARDPGEKVVR